MRRWLMVLFERDVYCQTTQDAASCTTQLAASTQQHGVLLASTQQNSSAT